MINERIARKFCKDDLSKIENYELAKTDTTQTWDLHHRDEIRKLPSGMIVYRSMQDLKDNNRYFNCPANELIFLTHAEHTILHKKGKPLSSEHRQKIAKFQKGRLTGKNNPMYGKTFSTVHKQKISEAIKEWWAHRRKEQPQEQI